MRVFGAGSISPIEVSSDPTLEGMANACRLTYGERVHGRRFAVRARRIGSIGVSTKDVECALGAVLDDRGQVDLESPEITVFVEIFPGRAHLFSQRLPGAGGLPGAVQGRALCLLSGGFDSAVAAWRIMKRGMAVDYLLCNLGGAAYERMVLQVAKVLAENWEFGQRPTFHAVDFSHVPDALRAGVDERYQQIVLKRLMYRVGAAVARQIGADALVTGESLGQVSSQTPANLRAIEDAAGEFPVHRPLVSLDKQEIIAEARRIATAPLSERVREFCALDGGRPVVRAAPGRAAEEEARLGDAILTEALHAHKTISVLDVTPDDLRAPYLFTSAIPAEAVVIDCRPEGLYQSWHVPGALRMDPADLMSGFRDLDKRRTYVLYCSFGTQTPLIAEVMQQFGYEAYAFRGGIGAIQAFVEHRHEA